jgi:hypothetical protein
MWHALTRATILGALCTFSITLDFKIGSKLHFNIVWLEVKNVFGNKFHIYILLINNQIYKIISDANLSNLTTIQMQTHNTAPEDGNLALIGKIMLKFSNVKVFLVNDFKRFG